MLLRMNLLSSAKRGLTSLMRVISCLLPVGLVFSPVAPAVVFWVWIWVVCALFDSELSWPSDSDSLVLKVLSRKGWLRGHKTGLGFPSSALYPTEWSVGLTA